MRYLPSRLFCGRRAGSVLSVSGRQDLKQRGIGLHRLHAWHLFRRRWEPKLPLLPSRNLPDCRRQFILYGVRCRHLP